MQMDWRLKVKKANANKNKRKSVTIDDLATHLGISKATVSLALNNSPLVAERTKKNVLDAAERFGYRPNYFGARLSKGKSDVIGLYILGGTETQCNWILPSSWMFYNPILKGVSGEVSSHGYRLQLEVISLEQALEQNVIADIIQEGSLDGMLLVVQDEIDYSFLEVVAQRQFPFVVLNARVCDQLSSVKVNNELGAKKAVKYLFAQGHERIGFISGPHKDLNAIERYHGFMEAYASAGFTFKDEMIQHGDWQKESGAEAVKTFMKLPQPPTALFCANDHMAIGAIQTMVSMGINVPGDVSVIGFDDAEVSEIVVPNLTTVKQSLDQMGLLGAQEVLRQVNDPSSEKTHENLEPDLILRDSVQAVKRKTSGKV